MHFVGADPHLPTEKGMTVQEHGPWGVSTVTKGGVCLQVGLPIPHLEVGGLRKWSPKSPPFLHFRFL